MIQLDTILTYDIEIDFISENEIVLNFDSGLSVYANGVKKVSDVKAIDFFDGTNTNVQVDLHNGRARVYINSTASGVGIGTVTTFSAGDLSPLFTSSVANASTTPALTFAQVSQSQNLVFASPNGSAGVPTFRALVAGDIPDLSSVYDVAGLATTAYNNAIQRANHTGTQPVSTISGLGTGVETFLGTPSWTNFNSMITGTAPYRGLNGTYTATGTVTDAFGSNPWLVTSGVTTGTGATAGIRVTGNLLTTGNLFDASTSSATSGAVAAFSSTSTANSYTAGTNGQVVISSSGTNANSGRSTIGLFVGVTNAGASSTNYGIVSSVSGATNNYSIVTINGRALFGATSTNAASRLSVIHDGTTAGIVSFRNASDVNSVSAFATGYFGFGSAATFPTIGITSTAAWAANTDYAVTGEGFNYASILTTTANRVGHLFSNTSNINPASGTSDFIRIASSFTPASGTAEYRNLALRYTVNTTGSYAGNVYGILIDPTITSATGANLYAIASDSDAGSWGVGTLTPTSWLQIAAGTTAKAQLRLTAGVAPSSPNDGDIYYINTNDRLMFYKNATASEILAASAVTTEVVVSDTTLTLQYNGTTYKILARA